MPRKKSRSGPGRAVTVIDIARGLGISAMTVSRALSGKGHVSEKTKTVVQEAAARMGYRPNRMARSLVTRRSGLIGLLIPDISHSFWAEITRGVQEVIERQGYNLLLCSSNRDPAAEVREAEALLSAHVDGLLVASEQPEECFQYFEGLLAQRVNLVLIDRYFDKLSCAHVGTDDFAAGRLATEHLIRLGHHAIAHVCGASIRPARLRKEGYLAALREHGIRPNSVWVAPGGFRLAESREAAKFLMRLRERPTAIVAGNDHSAFGVIRGCREAGFRVPEDISVVGVGNVEGDQHPNPFLTTVDWDRLEMGREAARLLLASIEGRPAPAPPQVAFPPAVLIRQSTAPPAEPR